MKEHSVLTTGAPAAVSLFYCKTRKHLEGQSAATIADPGRVWTRLFFCLSGVEYLLEYKKDVRSTTAGCPNTVRQRIQERMILNVQSGTVVPTMYFSQQQQRASQIDLEGNESWHHRLGIIGPYSDRL
jgi:hypothetical protein